jgi:uncharacterized protein YbjT (DUF2867 family)
MRAMIFGATGMVGQAVLLEALDDPGITEVLVVGRTPVPQRNPKLTQITQPDLFDLSQVADQLAGYDACFFCLGVSSAGMKEPQYRRLTFDLTMAIANTLAPLNTEMAFLYISGESTDSTEQGRVMWARVKGATENAVMALPFIGYAIRPGFIQPERGVRSKTGWYAAIYRVTGWAYPLIRRLAPKFVITSGQLGRAMIAIARDRPAQRIWANRELTALAQKQR